MRRCFLSISLVAAAFWSAACVPQNTKHEPIAEKPIPVLKPEEIITVTDYDALVMGSKEQKRIGEFPEALRYLVFHGDLKVDQNKDCSKNAKVEIHSTKIEEPILFNKNTGAAFSGLWRHVLDVTQCGEQYRFNAIRTLHQIPQGTVGSFSAIFGNTLTSVALMREAETAVHQALAVKVPEASCPRKQRAGQPALRQTSILQQPDARTGEWVEQWLYSACDQKAYSTTIVFRPTSEGKTFIAVGELANQHSNEPLEGKDGPLMMKLN